MSRTPLLTPLTAAALLSGTAFALPAPQSSAPEIGADVRGPLYVVSPPPTCTQSAMVSVSNSTPAAILDQQTTTSTLVISGANPYTWDVELSTSITHMSNIELEIRLTSPAGTVCTIATAAGGLHSDVFNGTVWDDQASANGPCSDFTYTSGVTATPLQPEGAFDMFRGEDPNGTWTLEVYDRAVSNTGSLNGWSLDVTAMTSAPAQPIMFSAPSPDVPKTITDFTTSTSVTPIIGLGTFISDVEVVLDITHNFSDDLEITLTSPAGTVVVITTDNGGPTNDVFAGTTFDDDVADTVTDHLYTNNVVATPLSPEGSFASLIGENPNGNWTLTIYDDRANNTGTLNGWTLVITTAGCVPAPSNYCTPGTSNFGCVPTMTYTAVNPPSISAGSGFTVTCTNMDGFRNGGLYYGLASASQQISGGSSYFCNTTPRQRLLQFPNNQTGGSLASCTGSLSADLNAFIASHPSGLGSPFFVGQTLYLQGFNRDPGNASKNLNFSDGLAVTLTP